MNKQWLKSFFNYKKLENSPQLQKFKKYLKRHPYLWELHCEAVARGVAVGLFIGIIPLIPFQTILAIGVAILLRANFPIAFLVSWISNPLTILPIAYLTYYIGAWLLYGHATISTTAQFPWQMDNMHDVWMAFGIPFFVGLPILAFGVASLGYLMVKIVWQLSMKSSKFTKK